MKKCICTILSLILLLSLTACAETITGETTVIATVVPTETKAEETVSYQDGVYTVSTVDEFIAAIGSDREIRLEPGI